MITWIANQDVTLILSAMLGALLLLRSVVNPDLSSRLLDETRASLLRLIAAEWSST